MAVPEPVEGPPDPAPEPQLWSLSLSKGRPTAPSLLRRWGLQKDYL